MSQSTVLRALLGLTATNLAISAVGAYSANAKLERNYEEAEARMDELEGTLRGHIGIIEESLERIEAVAKTGGLGRGIGDKAEKLYAARGRDEAQNEKQGKGE